MENFISQAAANFLGTLGGGILLFFFFENRLRKFEKDRVRAKLFKNIYSELVSNLIIAERIIAAPIDTNAFPIARFKTKRLEDFLYARPVEDKNDFYNKMQAAIINMESDNSLLDLVFTGGNPNDISTNKREIKGTAPSLKKQIEELIVTLTEMDVSFNYLQKK
jgi:hypothetical protein